MWRCSFWGAPQEGKRSPWSQRPLEGLLCVLVLLWAGEVPSALMYSYLSLPNQRSLGLSSAFASLSLSRLDRVGGAGRGRS